MSGLYVKLDAEYACDPRLLEAGPLAELLYIRGLCFCKRTMVDGIITDRQLNVIALGIPKAKEHAAALVECGAWLRSDTGWIVSSWLKHNKSVAEIVLDKEARRAASALANHTQYHVGAGKKPSAKCELCRSFDGSDLEDYQR